MAMSDLCKACGLCCDGSLFGRGTLEPDEVPMARKLRLVVVGNGKSFEQPCSALAGRSCSVYDARPLACRAFECVLYTRSTPLEERVAIVTRTRALLARVDTLSDAELEELRERMEEDFARARGVV